MAKLIHMSDIHLEGDMVREKGLEEIVAFANEKEVDQLAFGGDIVGNTMRFLALTLAKNGKVSSAEEAYAALAQGTYTDANQIFSQFNGEKHGVVGNHDPVGMIETMTALDFEPTSYMGKAYMENAPLSQMGFPKGDAITIPEDKKKIEHAIKNKPPIMLWHQGPYDMDYGEGSTFTCPDELKAVGAAAKINLHGHNHGSFIEYDAEKKQINSNMSEGTFLILEYDDSYNPIAYEVYQNATIANHKLDLKANVEMMYNSIVQAQESMPENSAEKKAA